VKVAAGREKKRLRQSGILPFEVEEVLGRSAITSFAGLPLVVEAFRACGADRAVGEGPPTRVRHRERGLSDAQMAESFCLLLAAGGEHVEDFETLRDDDGLAELVGYELPSPTRAKEYLYAFDEGMKPRGGEGAQQELFGGKVGLERGPIEALAAAVRASVRAAQLGRPCREATIDLDASIVVSEKREAAPTYTGESGYQPTLALWAEQEMVLYEEFRDGNVPAGKDVLRVLQRAVEALPEGVERISFRADTAAYTHQVLNWCRDEAGITFAISADMSVELRSVIKGLDEGAWEPLEVKGDVARSWAEVEFIPSAPSVVKGRRPDRYLAIRLEPVQRELFADGTRVKHFAVVTNDWERPGPELLRWQRQKAGTIEKLHDVLKNDLGAGVMPCGRFGANAAWFRLNVLCYNVLTLVRREGLGGELSKARPKRLRLWVLCRAGQIVHHARALVVRVSWRVPWLMGRIAAARRKLLQLGWQVLGWERARASPQPA
jgi:hypothetical protein